MARFAFGSLLSAIAILGACSSSSSPSPACSEGLGPQGYSFSVGSQCLRLSSVRVLSQGTWTAIDIASASIHSDSDSAARLELSALAPAQAFELTLEGLRGSAMLQQGYQSWSFAGAVLIPEKTPLDSDGSLLAPVPLDGNPMEEALGVSYGSTVLAEPSGPSLAIGALSSQIATTALGLSRSSDGLVTLRILYGPAREALPSDAQGKASIEPLLFVERPDANQALSVLSAQMQKSLPPGTLPPRRPPGGWYSWNEFFDAVREDDIRGQLDLIETNLKPRGLSLVEIDDGWEMAWGDWQANEKFPNGMENLGREIQSRGLIPGLWLAPFLVDIHSGPAQSAPSDYFVRGADGTPLVHRPSGSQKDYYILDGTNPEAMALVAEPIAKLKASGYGFFKLDFLYAGAIPGQRKVPGATGLQALRTGLTQLRTAMGDAVFNACGAPINPVLGLADSLRVGSDTAFAQLSLNWANIVFAARSTSARAFLAPLVYPDGDQTQVREPYSIEEAKASAFVAALSGPAYALGDNLLKLPQDRMSLALDDTVIDLAQASAPAQAIDPLESPTQHLIQAPLFDSLGYPHSTGAPPPSRFRMIGKSGKAYDLTFEWKENHSVTIAP